MYVVDVLVLYTFIHIYLCKKILYQYVYIYIYILFDNIFIENYVNNLHFL